MPSTGTALTTRAKKSVKAVKGKSTENSPITIDDDDDEDDDDEGDQTMKSASSLKKSASADSMGDSDSLPDLDAEPPTIAPEKPSVKEKKSGMNNIVQDVRLKCGEVPMPTIEPNFEDNAGTKHFGKLKNT